MVYFPFLWMGCYQSFLCLLWTQVWCESGPACDLQLYPCRTPNPATATAPIIEIKMGLGPRGGWVMFDLKRVKCCLWGTEQMAKRILGIWLKVAGRNEASSLLILENQRATMEDRIQFFSLFFTLVQLCSWAYFCSHAFKHLLL